RLARAIENTFGLIDVCLTQHRAEIFETQAIRREGRRICLNADGRFLPAADGDESDTRKLRYLLREGCVGEVLDLRERQRVGGQRESQNRRVRRVYLAIDRRIGKIFWEVGGCSVDRCLHLLFGDVDILIKVELQDDQRASKRTC